MNAGPIFLNCIPAKTESAITGETGLVVVLPAFCALRVMLVETAKTITRDWMEIFMVEMGELEKRVTFLKVAK